MIFDNREVNEKNIIIIEIIYLILMKNKFIKNDHIFFRQNNLICFINI